MNSKVVILLFFAGIAGLSGCKNKDTPTPVGLTTLVTVSNATGDTINFYVNGNRENNLSSIYPVGTSGYIPVPAGLQNYSFKKRKNSMVLLSTPYMFDTAGYYSIFVGGETADKTFWKKDDLQLAANKVASDTTGSSATIRFVNASPTETFDVIVGTGDTVNLKNCVFKFDSPFILIKAGVRAVKITKNGDSTPVIDTSVTLAAGSTNTIFTKGIIGGKGKSALRMGFTNNANNQ